jgi:hypothetical protein
VKNLPRTIINADDALARGMDFAFVTLGFFGVGFLIDRWLGTTPLFMILLVVVALVGLFARIWYQYEASMRQHEAERASASRGAGVAAPVRVEAQQAQHAHVGREVTGEGIGA